MSRIVRNSVLNGSAMAVTSVLSLILVPVLIRRYGLEAYGLIPLLRLLTPLGAMGIATFGLPQLASRTGAIHAARGERQELRRTQSALVAVSMLGGICAAAVMFALGSERVADWFNVGTTQRDAFVIGFWTVALLLPLLIPGAVLNASLTGLGEFRVLRLNEVLVYIVYFAFAVAAAREGLAIVWILIAFLSADALRAAGLLWMARRKSLISIHEIAAPDFAWVKAQRRDFGVLSVSSLLGYGRKHIAAACIALLFGPGALGLYDAMERVPRAFKSLLGLVNTTALPHAMRLDAAGRPAELRSLLLRGTRLTLACILPFAIVAILYAKEIVTMWLGPRLAYGSVFLMLLMVPFVLNSTMSIVSTATLSRIKLVAMQSAISMFEILVFSAAVALLVAPLGGGSPYAATAIAAAAGYVLRMRILLPAYGISSGLWVGMLLKILVGSAVGSGLVYFSARMAGAPLKLTLSTAPLAALAGAGAVVLMWNQGERKDLRTIVDSLRSMLVFRASR